MKKTVSGFGIFFMLLVKRPPIPLFSVFCKEYIVAVHSLSRKKIAMQYSIN
jgi:hypothetical protein